MYTTFSYRLYLWCSFYAKSKPSFTFLIISSRIFNLISECDVISRSFSRELHTQRLKMMMNEPENLIKKLRNGAYVLKNKRLITRDKIQ